MPFSFIISSLNNKNKQLQECILSIEKAYEYNKDCEIEILIILQGLNKNNENLKINYPELVNFYYVEKKGLSYARNYGIKKSRGNFLIFLDDDAKIKKDFLQVLTRESHNSSAGAFCGRILECHTNRCFTAYFLNEKRLFLKMTDFRCFMGSSHVIKKEIIEKICFYDEEFGAGSKYHGAEESDLFFRLKRQGIKIQYLPDLIFYHPIYGPSQSKTFNYAYAIGAMLKKQLISDVKHSLLYLFIAGEIILKSFLRSIQKLFFKSIEIKDRQFHYKAAFTGVLKGFLQYNKNIERHEDRY